MSNLFLFLFQGAVTPFVHSNSSLDYLKLWAHLPYTTIKIYTVVSIMVKNTKKNKLQQRKPFSDI